MRWLRKWDEKLNEGLDYQMHEFTQTSKEK